jgi:hypothetical protein
LGIISGMLLGVAVTKYKNKSNQDN